ncbi:MAG: tRNA pseudouridine(55) synthase TruB [Acidobacteria bacterium RIFCSPLOWO2_02_FULL_59_13]|nr:MAG: tRNA pseudouridine(55) synthase TruB [Acidobacteria bacterium RIFCSPLOWO2_02_FULL_59_13]
MDGVLVLDKPQGITSHAAVVAARRILGESRIGHLGTLDPFSTGVLVLLVGQITRLAQFYREREKVYEGTIRFGFSTDTFDCTGTPTSVEQVPRLDETNLRKLLREVVGTHLQQPPPFSAKKTAGVPAYRLARKGKPVQLSPVPVTIWELDLLSVEGPLVLVRTRVSAGTYIRSLAHDLGRQLGVGAHLYQLRRVAVGEFHQNQALSLEQLEEKVRHQENALIPTEELLPEFPAVVLTDKASRTAARGGNVEICSSAQWVRLFEESGKLLSIAKRMDGNLFHPEVVLGDNQTRPL